MGVNNAKQFRTASWIRSEEGNDFISSKILSNWLLKFGDVVRWINRGMEERIDVRRNLLLIINLRITFGLVSGREDQIDGSAPWKIELFVMCDVSIMGFVYCGNH